MIKLSNIYNEIKLINPNQYSKDKKWVEKINNIDELETFFSLLRKLNYKWYSTSTKNEIEFKRGYWESLPMLFPLKIYGNYYEKGTITWN